VKVMAILKDKWYVIHPAYGKVYELKVVLGAEISPTATDDYYKAVNTHEPGKFNSVDYISDGPFDTKASADEQKRHAHAHNFAMWGSADDDKPGDNNRR